MEKLLKEALNTSKLSVLGQFGGCIAKDASGYEIDGGKRIFVKSGVSNASHMVHVLMWTTSNLTDKGTY